MPDTPPPHREQEPQSPLIGAFGELAWARYCALRASRASGNRKQLWTQAGAGETAAYQGIADNAAGLYLGALRAHDASSIWKGFAETVAREYHERPRRDELFGSMMGETRERVKKTAGIGDVDPEKFASYLEREKAAVTGRASQYYLDRIAPRIKTEEQRSEEYARAESYHHNGNGKAKSRNGFHGRNGSRNGNDAHDTDGRQNEDDETIDVDGRGNTRRGTNGKREQADSSGFFQFEMHRMMRSMQRQLKEIADLLRGNPTHDQREEAATRAREAQENMQEFMRTHAEQNNAAFQALLQGVMTQMATFAEQARQPTAETMELRQKVADLAAEMKKVPNLLAEMQRNHDAAMAAFAQSQNDARQAQQQDIDLKLKKVSEKKSEAKGGGGKATKLGVQLGAYTGPSKEAVLSHGVDATTARGLRLFMGVPKEEKKQDHAPVAPIPQPEAKKEEKPAEAAKEDKKDEKKEKKAA